MDWRITLVEQNNDEVTVTAQISIELGEFQNLLGSPSFAKGKPAVYIPKKKKPGKYKKRAPKPLTRSERMAKAWETRRAKKEALAEEDEDEPDDDVSDEKVKRMQKLQNKIDKVREDLNEVPERP